MSILGAGHQTRSGALSGAELSEPTRTAKHKVPGRVAVRASQIDPKRTLTLPTLVNEDRAER
jgi:hypothetical protein